MVPDATGTVALTNVSPPYDDPSAVMIAAGEDDEVAALSANDATLVLTGTLTVAGDLALQDVGTLSLNGGSLDVGGELSVDASSGIVGRGVVTGQLMLDGYLDAAPGYQLPAQLYIEGDVSGPGVLEIGTEPDVKGERSFIELGAADSSRVAFSAFGGVLAIDHPAEFTGAIIPGALSYNSDGGTIADDEVLLGGLSFADVTGFTYAGNAQGGVVTVAAGGATVSLQVAGDHTPGDFTLSAGPNSTAGDPSVILDITPTLPAPTLGVTAADGEWLTRAIVNTGMPAVSGAIPADAALALTADAGTQEGGVAQDLDTHAARSYDMPLATALAPGLHDIVATATGFAGGAGSDPLDLFVLPDPVAGITTAAVSSFQFGALLDQGYSMSFVAGTEAIRLTDGTLSVGADTVQASVQRLYEGLLGRAGDTGGLVQFTAIAAASGTSAVADAVLGSPEFAQAHGAPAGLSDTGFLTLLYNGLLGRAPDAGGLASHVAALEGGASQGSVAAGIADSVEARAHFATATANVWVPDATGALVTELYQTSFGHAPDLGGLALFTSALQGGLSAQQLAQDLASSPEFLADHDGLGNAALVTSLYENGLGRAPSAADLQHWAGASTATVLFGVAASPEAAVHLIRNV